MTKWAKRYTTSAKYYPSMADTNEIQNTLLLLIIDQYTIHCVYMHHLCCLLCYFISTTTESICGASICLRTAVSIEYFPTLLPKSKPTHLCVHTHLCVSVLYYKDSCLVTVTFLIPKLAAANSSTSFMTRIKRHLGMHKHKHTHTLALLTS